MKYVNNDINTRIASKQLGKSLSQSTALAGFRFDLSVSATGAIVNQFYRSSPLVAGFLTCGIKASIADRLAQWRDVCTTKFSKRRNFAMVMYSGIVLGLVCEVMYNTLFPRMFGTTASIMRTVKITLFDGFINAPLLWLPPAYFIQALVYGYPMKEALGKYVTDVREKGLLTKYWSLWLPATFLNFSVVPDHYHVAFVAGVSFFWMIILSVVANNKDKLPINCPVDEEPAILNPRALD